MVLQNLRKAHLQELGLTQILGDGDFVDICSAGQMAGKHIPGYS